MNGLKRPLAVLCNIFQALQIGNEKVSSVFLQIETVTDKIL